MQKTVVDALADRFRDCRAEKNWSLIRFDIIQGLRNVYNEVKDEMIKRTALELVDAEEDIEYRKKYAGVWKEKPVPRSYL